MLQPLAVQGPLDVQSLDGLVEGSTRFPVDSPCAGSASTIFPTDSSEVEPRFQDEHTKNSQNVKTIPAKPTGH
eukprot:2027320-Rhodomonas_salina.1